MSVQSRDVTVCDYCDDVITGDSDTCEWCEGQDFCDGGDCWSEHRSDMHFCCDLCGEMYRNYEDAKQIGGFYYCAGCAKEKEAEAEAEAPEIDNLNIITTLSPQVTPG